LIYSSVTNFDVFARRKPVTATNCVQVKPDKPGAVYAERCCDTTTYFNDAGQPAFSQTVCQVCQYSGGGSLVDCTTVMKPGNPGGLNPLPSAGAEQPPPGSNNTSTLPPGGIIKVPPGATNALGPTGNNTALVPPGVVKPTGNTTNATPPTTLLAKQPSSGHHHHKGGQTSTSSSNTNSTGH
jgi:hypothetical protein